MTRRLWTLAAVTAIGLGLLISPVNAANPCKRDCVVAKKACIVAARTAKTACLGAGGDKAACKATFKTEKRACIDDFLAKKVACKTDKENTSVCSPSGAFLD